METEKMNLLTGAELVRLFNAITPNTKAEVVANKIKTNLFIANENEIYILQKNKVYKLIQKDEIYPTITKFLQLSYEAIDNESKKLLEDKFEKKSEFNKFIIKKLSNDEIKTYEPQLKQCLKVPTKLDDYTWQIHFKNGYLDLKTNAFKQRDIANQKITYCIDREYKKSTEKEKAELLSHISKIYPNKEDLEYICYCIARCLIGQPEIDQDTLFLMGNGSSGKSFKLSLTQQALGGDNGYVTQLQSNAFEENNSKRDKILNTFATNKYKRICWVNEFSDKKIAGDDFKNFCDGKIQTTKLYQDGTTQIKLTCKIIATTNLMPNFKIDSGMVRRFKAYYHSSLFTDNVEEVNAKKHVYLKDKSLLIKIKDRNLLNAWVDILSSYCKDIYNNKIIPQPKSFQQAADLVVNTNDFVKDFVDGCITITNKDEDRICKNEMKALFESKNPNKHLSIQQLITNLREKNIQYNFSYRKNGSRGCFTGVKVKDAETDDDIDEQPTQIKKETKPPVHDLRKEVNQLKTSGKDKYIKVIGKEIVKAKKDLDEIIEDFDTILDII